MASTHAIDVAAYEQRPSIGVDRKVSAPRPTTLDERQRAMRSVAHHSKTAEECAQFIEMLGLNINEIAD